MQQFEHTSFVQNNNQPFEKVVDFLNYNPDLQNIIDKSMALNLHANKQLINKLKPTKLYAEEGTHHIDTEDEDEVFDASILMDDSLD